jgi:hypothetical protein
MLPVDEQRENARGATAPSGADAQTARSRARIANASRPNAEPVARRSGAISSRQSAPPPLRPQRYEQRTSSAYDHRAALDGPPRRALIAGRSSTSRGRHDEGEAEQSAPAGARRMSAALYDARSGSMRDPMTRCRPASRGS